MSDKSRVTVVVCTNASGNKKVPLMMIGTAAKPRCFANTPCPIVYTSQKNAWMDTHVCHTWLNNVFMPFVRLNNGGRKVILLWDGLKAHNCDSLHAQLESANISTILLPPNTTSVYQPLDQGVIAALKKRYRSNLLEVNLRNLNSLRELRRQGALLPSGTAGLSYGLDAHLLDVSKILKTVWDMVGPQVIMNCFIKSTILPDRLNDALKSCSDHHCSDDVNDRLSKSVSELVSSLSEMRLSVKEKQVEAEVAAWFIVDDDPTALVTYVSNISDIALELECEGDDLEVSRTYSPFENVPPEPTPPPASTPPDMRNRLEYLKKLHEEGLLPVTVYNEACLAILKEFQFVQ